MLISPKFNAMPFKIPANFLKIEINKPVIKFIEKHKGPGIAKTLKKNKVENLH